ncbi:Transcription regulator LuxR, C-terminal [uncultured Caudovirales phage]|uniref:Transcription regulator LuxR, C-terminal n=1 Tax=uncultured Caudovirales phage TaxID=2100421 RepID=A0A6J7WQT0_9CAUD|nr:Transcription regulator LuxR, C-terminal [uncultured Caudovirales phage]
MTTKSKESLEERLAVLEQQMRMVLMTLGKEGADRDVVACFAKMTPRMHGALQCMLGGASNRDIAARFLIQETTAKVYVRAVAKKMGVKTRSEIVAKSLATFKAMSDGEYEKLSGIGKTWFESGAIWRAKDDGEFSGAEE